MARDHGRLAGRELDVRAAYAAHGAELYRFALRQLGDGGAAQDVVQEVFLRAWRSADAYERLLMDVVRGDATLFMRGDEVEAAWRWAEPILDAWHGSDESPKTYVAGSWGPTAATAMIERDGRTWYEDA